MTLPTAAVINLRASRCTPCQAKRILGDTNFMRSLEEFDKDAIPDAVIKKLKRYIDDPNYTPGASRFQLPLTACQLSSCAPVLLMAACHAATCCQATVWLDNIGVLCLCSAAAVELKPCLPNPMSPAPFMHHR